MSVPHHPWPTVVSTIWQLFVFTLFCLFTRAVFATEPLLDELDDGETIGTISPQKCCWVDLPPSAQLQKMRLAERCSAIGGPAGRFKLEAGKLWLVGLRRCGGNVELAEVYPELQAPVAATWLSGHFSGRFGQLCLRADGMAVYRKQLSLEIERGVITRSTETKGDETTCLTPHMLK